MKNKVQAFWLRFLQKNNLPVNTRYLEAFYFDTTEESAKDLCNLVLQEKKQATASSLYHYQSTGEEMPKVGDYSIVTNFAGDPYAVIQTTNISIVPFKDLTYDVVKREGEDKNLASWREKHIRYYQVDGQASGYEFDEDMPVVFEDFKLVYKEKDQCE